MAEEDGKYLLLSKYGLDAKPYHSQDVDIAWEKSTIREWLNQDFMNSAFTEGEQALISETKVDNSETAGYSGYDARGGNNTKDQVFLLSYKEAFEDYFTSDTARICMPTNYAVQQGAWEIVTTGACWWWLRSPGDVWSNAIYVDPDGSRSLDYVPDENLCVRPALWIDLKSDIF